MPRMSLPGKIITSLGFLIVLTGLGFADAYYKGNRVIYPEADEEIVDFPPEQPPAIDDIPGRLESMGLLLAVTSERSMIERILPAGTTVASSVLLENADRAGFIAFAQSPEVRRSFLALKETLHASFSADVTELLDEIRDAPDGTPYNYLTFRDPTLGSERFVFLLRGFDLLEFHVTDGKEATIDAAIQAILE